MLRSQARQVAAAPLVRAPSRGLPARDLAAIAAGGGLGSAARYLVGIAFGHGAGSAFPWPTFTINVSGSLLLGLVMTWMIEGWPARRGARLFLTTGLLGGYTTFSAYSAGILTLLQDRAFARADAYALSSVLAGVTAIWCGIVLGRWLTAICSGSAGDASA